MGKVILSILLTFLFLGLLGMGLIGCMIALII